MLDRFREIAPLMDWAVLVLATAMFLAAAVAFGHAQVARRGFGEEHPGPGGSGTLASMMRWTVGLTAGGLSATGLLLGWSTVFVVLLGAAAAVPLAIEGVVRIVGDSD